MEISKPRAVDGHSGSNGLSHVLSPAPGAVLSSGSDVMIRWKNEDFGRRFPTIDIELQDGETSEPLQTLATGVENCGYYFWNMANVPVSDRPVKLYLGNILSSANRGITSGSFFIANYREPRAGPPTSCSLLPSEKQAGARSLALSDKKRMGGVGNIYQRKEPSALFQNGNDRRRAGGTSAFEAAVWSESTSQANGADDFLTGGNTRLENWHERESKEEENFMDVGDDRQPENANDLMDATATDEKYNYEGRFGKRRGFNCDRGNSVDGASGGTGTRVDGDISLRCSGVQGGCRLENAATVPSALDILDSSRAVFNVNGEHFSFSHGESANGSATSTARSAGVTKPLNRAVAAAGCSALERGVGAAQPCERETINWADHPEFVYWAVYMDAATVRRCLRAVVKDMRNTAQTVLDNGDSAGMFCVRYLLGLYYKKRVSNEIQRDIAHGTYEPNEALLRAWKGPRAGRVPTSRPARKPKSASAPSACMKLAAAAAAASTAAESAPDPGTSSSLAFASRAPTSTTREFAERQNVSRSFANVRHPEGPGQPARTNFEEACQMRLLTRTVPSKMSATIAPDARSDQIGSTFHHCAASGDMFTPSPVAGSHSSASSAVFPGSSAPRRHNLRPPKHACS